jgi:hypothetical protein
VARARARALRRREGAQRDDERARALLTAVRAKQKPEFVFYASAARLSDEFE